MDISLSYDCDIEVWTFFSKTVTQEFTTIPTITDLIKPRAVRMKPPFPWDNEAPPQVTLSLPLKQDKMQVGSPSVAGNNNGKQTIMKTTKHTVTWEETDSSLDLQTVSLKEKLAMALEELGIVRAELDEARTELHEVRQVSQCLDRKNRHAQLHARQLRRENITLKQDLKLIQERDSSFKERISRLLEEQSRLSGRSRLCSTESSRMCQTKHCHHLVGMDDNTLSVDRSSLKKEGKFRRRSEGICEVNCIEVKTDGKFRRRSEGIGELKFLDQVKPKVKRSYSMRDNDSCSKTSPRGIIKRFRNSIRRLTTS